MAYGSKKGLYIFLHIQMQIGQAAPLIDDAQVVNVYF